VLFDFDGTLADTAPDLAAAVNQLRAERGMERLSNEAVRPYASMGARGLLRIGFGLAPATRTIRACATRSWSAMPSAFASTRACSPHARTPA